MLVQITLVVMVSIASVAYLSLRAWRTWSAKSGCSGGCGCAATKKADKPALIGVEELMGRVQQQAAKR